MAAVIPTYLSSRPCPKCAAKDATTAFCGTGSRYRRYFCDQVPSHAEHIARTCTRCGYSWDEAPIDAIEAAT